MGTVGMLFYRNRIARAYSQLRNIAEDWPIFKISCFSIMAVVAVFALGSTKVAAKIVKCPLGIDSTICITDAGGANVVKECFRGADGKLNLFYGEGLLEVVPASEEFQKMITEACETMEIASKDCDISPMFVSIGKNAIAGKCDGAKAILFDKNILTLFGQPEVKFVIFHELGHHFCGHLDQFRSPEDELEADAFAGAGFRILGLSLEDALSILDTIDIRESGSYPDVALRASGISKGWMEPGIAKSCR